MITSISMYRQTDNCIYGVSHQAKRYFKLQLPPRENHILDVPSDTYKTIFHGIDFQQTTRLDEQDYSYTSESAIDGIDDYKGI